MRRLLVSVVCAALVLTGCSTAPSITQSTATTVMATTTQFLPKPESVVYKNGLIALTEADRILKVCATWKQAKTVKPANMEAIHETGQQLIDLCAVQLETLGKLLEAQTIIDKSENPVLGAYTYLVQTQVNLLAVQAKIDALNYSIDMPIDGAMLEYRNKLATTLGVETKTA